MEGLDKARLISLISHRAGLKESDIGKVDVKGAYSFFEVDKQFTRTVREHLHGFEYRGRMVRVEVTGGERERERRFPRKAEKQGKWGRPRDRKWR
jgi:ATP-dependent RNA helicase DeaD